MSSEHRSVLNVLSALNAKVSESDALLTGQGIGNALYGLQGMSSDVKEVQDILSALAVKIRCSKALLLGQGIVNCLYGLQEMSSEHTSVYIECSFSSNGKGF